MMFSSQNADFCDLLYDRTVTCIIGAAIRGTTCPLAWTRASLTSGSGLVIRQGQSPGQGNSPQTHGQGTIAGKRCCPDGISTPSTANIAPRWATTHAILMLSAQLLAFVFARHKTMLFDNHHHITTVGIAPIKDVAAVQGTLPAIIHVLHSNHKQMLQMLCASLFIQLLAVFIHMLQTHAQNPKPLT